MSHDTVKECEIGSEYIDKIQSELNGHNLALRALGELLGSSNFNEFSDEVRGEDNKVEAENLRWGITQLIDLCLVRQESIVTKYLALCREDENDARILEQSASDVSLIDQGAFTDREDATGRLRKVVINMEIIEKKNGRMEGQATALKEKCQNRLLNRCYEKESRSAKTHVA